MGKSRKKNPVVNHGSGKYFKQKANRALRHRVKQMLYTDPERDVLPILREVSNIYDSNKDGGITYWNDKYEHLGRSWNIGWYIWWKCETLEEEYAERLECYKKALRK